MEEHLLDINAVKEKAKVISLHRDVQKQDNATRSALRKRLVRAIMAMRKQLQLTLANPGKTAMALAILHEDLRELHGALHQILVDDQLAEEHWKRHFQLSEFVLTHNERKLLRALNPLTELKEHPRRTKSPVQRTIERASSPESDSPEMRRSSSFLRADGTTMMQPVVMRNKRPIRFSAIFRLPENSALSSSLRQHLPSAVREPEVVIDPVLDKRPLAVQIAHLNAQALPKLQLSHLRDAVRLLDRAMKLSDNATPAEQTRETHLARAVTLCNYSSYYRRVDDLRRARKCMDQCVAIEQEVLGAPSPSTVLNYCGLLLQSGDVAESRARANELLCALREGAADSRDSSSPRAAYRHLCALCEAHLATCDAVHSETLLRGGSPPSEVTGDVTNHYAHIEALLRGWKERWHSSPSSPSCTNNDPHDDALPSAVLLLASATEVPVSKKSTHGPTTEEESPVLLREEECASPAPTKESDADPHVGANERNESHNGSEREAVVAENDETAMTALPT